MIITVERIDLSKPKYPKIYVKGQKQSLSLERGISIESFAVGQSYEIEHRLEHVNHGGKEWDQPVLTSYRPATTPANQAPAATNGTTKSNGNGKYSAEEKARFEQKDKTITRLAMLKIAAILTGPGKTEKEFHAYLSMVESKLKAPTEFNDIEPAEILEDEEAPYQ